MDLGKNPPTAKRFQTRPLGSGEKRGSAEKKK